MWTWLPQDDCLSALHMLLHPAHTTGVVQMRKAVLLRWKPLRPALGLVVHDILFKMAHVLSACARLGGSIVSCGGPAAGQCHG